jgi:hypothetical protein
MNPYDRLPRQNFWKASAQSSSEIEVDFDCGRKFGFSGSDSFATAGSCFAQHFARQMTARGGKVLIAEKRHPLVPQESEHGYELFSARYGNIYTVQQLLELLEQAVGGRGPIHEYAVRTDGRWVDMLRPRAVPMGFPDIEHARADRQFHLHAVAEMLRDMDVFVFTLGLTEAWTNGRHGYCYPVVPGAIAGDFSAEDHRFVNYSFGDVTRGLRNVIDLVSRANPAARILFTVSPVGLVATAEPRNVMVSTSASKSILRAAIDEVVRQYEAVDYFPSYEIITGPYGRGRYWAEGLRDVTGAGVETVMDVFFHSRLHDLSQRPCGSVSAGAPAADPAMADIGKLAAALNDECDEMFLDPALRVK